MKLQKVLLFPFFVAFVGVWAIGFLLAHFGRKAWVLIRRISIKRVPLRWEVIGLQAKRGFFREL